MQLVSNPKMTFEYFLKPYAVPVHAMCNQKLNIKILVPHFLTVKQEEMASFNVSPFAFRSWNTLAPRRCDVSRLVTNKVNLEHPLSLPNIFVDKLGILGSTM